MTLCQSLPSWTGVPFAAPCTVVVESALSTSSDGEPLPPPFKAAPLLLSWHLRSEELATAGREKCQGGKLFIRMESTFPDKVLCGQIGPHQKKTNTLLRELGV